MSDGVVAVVLMVLWLPLLCAGTVLVVAGCVWVAERVETWQEKRQGGGRSDGEGEGESWGLAC